MPPARYQISEISRGSRVECHQQNPQSHQYISSLSRWWENTCLLRRECTAPKEYRCYLHWRDAKAVETNSDDRRSTTSDASKIQNTGMAIDVIDGILSSLELRVGESFGRCVCTSALSGSFDWKCKRYTTAKQSQNGKNCDTHLKADSWNHHSPRKTARGTHAMSWVPTLVVRGWSCWSWVSLLGFCSAPQHAWTYLYSPTSTRSSDAFCGDEAVAMCHGDSSAPVLLHWTTTSHWFVCWFYFCLSCDGVALLHTLSNICTSDVCICHTFPLLINSYNNLHV